jgi:hypothetical protein
MHLDLLVLAKVWAVAVTALSIRLDTLRAGAGSGRF